MFWRGLLARLQAPKVVENGYAFVEPCPACHRDTTFREVEICRSILFGHGEKLDLAFVCKDCGYELVDDAPRRRRR